MKDGHTRPALLGLVLIILSAHASACAERDRVLRQEGQPTPNAAGQQTANGATPAAAAPEQAGPSAAAQATPAPDLSPPQPAEVRGALARAYGDAVSAEAGASRAVVGDFNGDGSADIAVLVTPSKGKTGDLNSEVANWILQDPTQVAAPDPRKFDPHEGVQKLPPAPARPRVEPGDTLLAVIHGYREAGWRDPDAKQTFLLRNAAAAEMRAEARASVKAATEKPLPRLRGDVIRGRRGEDTGFLYWTGAGYGWFSLRK